MPQNSLTLVIDEQGIYYRVPICCINDPINFNVDYLQQKMKQKQKPPEKILQSIKVRSVGKPDQIFTISNLTSILTLKQ